MSDPGTLGTFDVWECFHFISSKLVVGRGARLRTVIDNFRRYVVGHHVAPADVRNFLTSQRER